MRTLFDTHFFGSVDMIKAVLPQMRARRSGTIVNLSSIGATIIPAGSGYYAAVKCAIEGLTGSLRKELEHNDSFRGSDSSDVHYGLLYNRPR